MKLVPILLIFILTGCSSRILTVRTEYINEEYLASYHVETPDPALYNPPVGQRLIIHWHLTCACDDMYLRLQVRYRNREENVIKVPISIKSGYYCYTLLDEEYCRTRGILTYRVELICDGCVVTEWRHQLWADLIEFQ